MANALTGDFDAVLQVSGAVINRLLASMHQNHGVKEDLPTFPHSVGLRIGDKHPVEGVRGSAWAQVSVPRVELIDGSRDRFRLEVDLRVRYKPDPGTSPLPEFIHGTVRAVYRLTGVDPDCWGWRGIAADYIWPRVEANTVSFTGTAVDDADFVVGQIGSALDDAEVNALITRQIVALLETQFAATPQKLTTGFRLGSLGSLNDGGHSGVVAPIPLDAGPPVGQIDSVGQLFLDGNDFAVAVSSDYILSQVQAILDELTATFALDVHFRHRTYVSLGFADVDVVQVSIDYRVTLTGAVAEWAGGWIPLLGLNAGIVTVKLWGEARTQRSEFNVSFDISQPVSLTFDWGAEGIALAAVGTPLVNVSVGGPFGSLIEPKVKSEIENAVKPHIQGVLNQAAGRLDLKNRKNELINQLRTLDDEAGARFEGASFSGDGVVLGGRISLAPRRAPAPTFEKTPEQNGYTAFQSWIPGGRIDRFEWSWGWFNGAAQPGADTEDDRFLLRRPGGSITTKFGVMKDLSRPLPGLDGMGHICLNVKGVHVDPQTGQLVPVETGLGCSRFGFELSLQPARLGRLFLREYDLAAEPREVGLFEVGTARAGAPSTNTLVVCLDRSWGEETAATLAKGLELCDRDDAGLLVLVLFPDGSMRELDAGGRAAFRELGQSLDAPLLSSEDVRGAWAEALDVPSGAGEPAWRLLSPDGGISWRHDGETTPEELAAGLEESLVKGPPAGAELVRPGLDLGARVRPIGLDPSFLGMLEQPCPPPPVGRGLGRVVVAFVRPDSDASRVELDRLMHEHGAARENGAFVAVVVDGENAEGVEHEFATIRDPDGEMAARFGVRHWPTIVRLNELGRVTAVEVGAAPRKPPREESA
jgi:hypothetical protein